MRWISATVLMLSLACRASAGAFENARSADSLRTVRAAEYAALRPATFRCGENALYLVMRLHGRVVGYEEVIKQVGAGTASRQEGASLLQLVRAGNKLGLPCVAKKYSGVGNLAPCTLPLIAHCAGGHYVVVARIDDKGICVIDGLSAECCELGLDTFRARWTGYVLEPSRRVPSLTVSAATLMSLGLGLGAYATMYSAIHCLRRMRTTR